SRTRRSAPAASSPPTSTAAATWARTWRSTAQGGSSPPATRRTATTPSSRSPARTPEIAQSRYVKCAAAPPACAAVTEALRVVIVDAHPSFRDVARQLLRLRGFSVVGEADNAAAAREAVDRLEPDAMLLGVRLGEDDGFALCASLTRARPDL